MTVRVLLADDDRAGRESLERALELEGYAVTSVADVVQALSVTRRAESNWDWHMFVWAQMRCELLILALGVSAGFRGGSAVCWVSP